MAFLSLLLLPCASNAKEALDEIRFRILEKVEEFNPEHVPAAPIDFAQLNFDKPNYFGKKLFKAGKGADASGFDSDVRFGTYRGRPAAIKFFKKSTYPRDLMPHPTPKDFAAKVKQGFFVFDSLHALDKAPEPFGYATGNELKEFVKKSGLRDEDYYGMIVMQKINPITYLRQGEVKGKLRKFDDPNVERQVREASHTLEGLGLQPGEDYEFVVDASRKFYFLDFDYWKVHSRNGIWQGGQNLGHGPAHCGISVSEILANLYHPPKPR